MNPSRPNRIPVLLVLLTIVGGILRFAVIAHQPLWMDEAATFARVVGKFSDMSARLHDQQTHFMPLHYELCWLLGHMTKLTPTVLRFVPALAGTLMIPAVYALALHFASRRAALLAAAFACCSGFLLFFARDAKMYMHFWLLCTLSMTCFLNWLRGDDGDGRGRLRFLAWVATTLTAVGLHAPGLMLIPVQAIMLLTSAQPRRWAAFLLGITILAAGPAGYYGRRVGNWEQSTVNRGSLAWIQDYYGHRSGPDLVRLASTAFLVGWEWPNADLGKRVPQAVLVTARAGCVALAVLLLLGLRARGRDADPPRDRGISATAACWLVVWIVLPAAVLYASSKRPASSPADWVATFFGLPARAWAVAFLAVPAALAIGFPGATANEMRRRAAWLLKVLLLPALLWGVLIVIGGLRSRGSVWVPRYLGVSWPAMAILVSVLLLRLPWRPLRWGAIALLLGGNLAFGLAPLRYPTRPPVDQMAADQDLSLRPDAKTLTLFYTGDRWDCDMLERPARYHFVRLDWGRLRPQRFDDRDYFQRTYHYRIDAPATSVAMELKRFDPACQRVIVWSLDPRPVQLPGGWQLSGEQATIVYSPLDWQRTCTLHRLEYQRSGGGS